MATTLAGSDLRSVLGRLPTGVVVVTGIVDGAPVGVALNSFTSVSLDPPLVSFCMARTSTTWPRLRSAERWAISVLGEGHEDVSRRFATRGADRFAGLDTAPAPGGGPVLAGSTAWLDCRLSAVHEAGDHDLVLAEVLHLGTGDRHGFDAAPLVFHQGRYHRLGAA